MDAFLMNKENKEGNESVSINNMNDQSMKPIKNHKESSQSFPPGS